MPVIDRFGPYRIFFFSNEWGEPPYIHIQREDKLAKYWLENVSLARSTGFAVHELNDIEAIVRENREKYIEAWNEYFGN